MTTIKDYLNDFFNDTANLVNRDDVIHMTQEDFEDAKENLLEEYDKKINRAKELEYANKS